MRDPRTITKAHSVRTMRGLLVPGLGFLALVWYLIRVVPRPSRASYPCQRVAAPLAFGFVSWVLSLGTTAFLWRNAKKALSRAHYSAAAILLLGGIAAAVWHIGLPQGTGEAFTPDDPPNTPMGTARGIRPGLVAWVRDPQATTWDDSGFPNYWWRDSYHDQAVINRMMANALLLITDQSAPAQAWGALFRSFNASHGRGDTGYQQGQTIAIKVNLNNAWEAGAESCSHQDNELDTSPHVVVALLDQLVNVAGVPQESIYVYDAVRKMQDWFYQRVHGPNERGQYPFPNVHYVDGGADHCREAVPGWTSSFHLSNGSGQARIADTAIQADYLINVAILKPHTWSTAITLSAKNFFGSMHQDDLTLFHNYITDRGMGAYDVRVDLLGHRALGGNTLLYLLDGLYGGANIKDVPYGWRLPPFNGQSPSSLFASQDPVALESVGLDFLRAEFTFGSFDNHADNYLHEAALANSPPSGTYYDPEGDGSRLGSLGVHEHWNSPSTKQYSRNLGIGSGIKLIYSANPPLPTATFVDVPFDHPYFGDIEALYRAGYTAGCSTDPLMYCPDATMNRAESSVFVERGIHTSAYDPPAPFSQVFADVALDSWAAKWVNGLWVDHYTAGCGTNPLIYCPWQGHTRAEGAVFYLRMLNGYDYSPPPPSQQIFTDVPLDAWYSGWVEAAYQADLIPPCATLPEMRFCPNDPLTRAMAAHMMVRAKGLRDPELAGGVVATFEVHSERFEIWVTNPQTIQQLFSLGIPQTKSGFPSGPILRGSGQGGRNFPWSWHLDPDATVITPASIELCDGMPSYVESNVDEFVYHIGAYCPWAAKLIRLEDFR